DLAADAEPWVKAELARMLPDLFPTAPDVPPSNSNESRLFEAIFSLLALLAREVDAIVVDDLQFLDAQSFEAGILAQSRLPTGGGTLGGKASGARLFAVFRSGALPADFEQSLALGVEFGVAVHVELRPLDAASVRSLLESLEVDDAARLAPRLRQLTGGNPRFIVEALKHLHESGRHEVDLAEHGELPERLAAL